MEPSDNQSSGVPLYRDEMKSSRIQSRPSILQSANVFFGKDAPFKANLNDSFEEQAFAGIIQNCQSPKFFPSSKTQIDKSKQPPLKRLSSKKNSLKLDQRHSKNSKLKSSDQFHFQGQNDELSLFNSQDEVEGQKGIQTKVQSQNLNKFKALLRQFYNDNYIAVINQKKRISYRASLFQSSLRRSGNSIVITRQPIVFKKKYEGAKSFQGLSGNFICRLIGKKIFYKNFSYQELGVAIQPTKCQSIQIGPQESISPSMEVDASTMRVFCYSNTTNELVIRSLNKSKNNEEICRIKVKSPRENPLLRLIQINKKQFLLLIGGYIKIEELEVEGSKIIQIFPIDKWGTQITKSKMIKLINGRIYPLIVYPIKIQEKEVILLLGGNTMAKKVGNQLSFKDYKSINTSSNVRGVFITPKQIIQCPQQTGNIMVLPNSNNISVQIEQKINLFSGYVDVFRVGQQNQIRLFLPKMREFYTIKVVKKEIRIIKSKESLEKNLSFEPQNAYQNLQMKCIKKAKQEFYYQIDEKGLFRQKQLSLSDLETQRNELLGYVSSNLHVEDFKCKFQIPPQLKSKPKKEEKFIQSKQMYNLQ